MTREIPELIHQLCAEIYRKALNNDQRSVHLLNARLLDFVGLASPNAEVRARTLRTMEHLRGLAAQCREMP
jgi:hypothetical protein